MEALTTARLAMTKERRGLAANMDRWSRGLLPRAYAIILAVFWVA